MKNQIWMFAVCAGALMLNACSSESSPVTKNEDAATAELDDSRNDKETPQTKPTEPVVINVDDFYDALLMREDKSGKTDLAYKMDLSRDAVIQFENAFFYAMSTGDVDWEAKFSSKKDGSTSIINCALIDRDEKEVFVQNDMKRLMTVTGTVQYLDGDTVFLKNCEFKEV